MHIDRGSSPPNSVPRQKDQDARIGQPENTTDVGKSDNNVVGHDSSCREVEWLDHGATGDTDSRTIATFLDSLSAEFGKRITDFIAKETGLNPVSNELDQRTVEQLEKMAEAQRQVFSGVNFFLELHCSAEGRTPAFREACAQARISPDRLDLATLKEIDSRFRDMIARESNANREPLTPALGQEFMVRILSDFASAEQLHADKQR